MLQHGHSLDRALAERRARLSGADGALLAALAYGVLREYRCLRTLIEPLLRRPPQPLLEALLLVGVYQLRAMRVPAHAAVHATVAASAALKLGKARGMVNAVLRRCQRELPALEARLPAVDAVRLSHPDWLAAQLAADWPGAEAAIMRANNTPAPMHLRVNRRATTRTACQRELAAAGIEATTLAAARDCLTLTQPLATSDLPGFAAGRVSVQDSAAQRAVDLLVPVDGNRVLDACAAPGNKTAHVLERAAVDMLALDVDGQRVQTLQANLARLRLPATVHTADAQHPDAWWDGRPFDRILLDAPCSGSGVIRRHPDIKWLRRPADIAAAAKRQRRLLAALWPLLADGGLLLYATCSVLRAEGDAVLQGFLAATEDAAPQPVAVAPAEPTAVGARLQPGADGGDGFYYALLKKAA